ncbi:cytochrome P450 [Streptomyces chryseus]|uniref:Cytochrome P450 n=1 Tax=Streptomyces chryseus TaxID=68186 RepID=A0ABQ3DUD5_9ACTN|nr:cytochrome P450 [Streptomyces chryseus]GHB15167.1 cytochrome P450 [Streptomyces chryseus]
MTTQTRDTSTGTEPEPPVHPLAQPADADARQLLEWFARGRSEAPVFWDESRQAWQVFRYEDYLTVSTHPQLFSSDFSPVFPVPEELALLMGPGTFGGIDPPRHGPLRKLVSQAFTPRRIARLESRTSAIGRELLAGLRDRDRVDVVADLAYPLPVIVIAELLGIPAEDRDLFREWVDVILNNEGLQYPNLPDDFAETMGPAIKEWSEYLYAHIAKKRAAPADDLMSGLVEAEADGQRLTDEQIVNIVALLLTAGHISSATLLGNLFLVLDEHPEALRELRADRSLIPGAIEETLRYRSPFNNIFRLLTEDTDILGHPMKAHQMVIAWSASANRDADHFPDPDRFDIRRSANKHMAFGHGIHHCLGAFLARQEAKVFLDLALDEFTSYHIDHDRVEFYDADQLTARHLPVRITRS